MAAETFETKDTSIGGAAAQKLRSQLKNEFWPSSVPWQGHREVGYFCAPRSLPFVLLALRAKKVSGNQDPGSVYLELLANHMGEGVVQVLLEDDHAFAAGYSRPEAWRSRMRVLESAGFIDARKSGNRAFATVLLIHPTIAMEGLHARGLVDEALWTAYRSSQMRSKEVSAEELRQKQQVGGD